ncbi:MAG TPA: GNAT family N-acetyltransferase [Chloroflexia bacterium]|nr:GNAT family N-acetyltransferase [Chloroflexia bacterium]
MVGSLIPGGTGTPRWLEEGSFSLRPVREADRDEIYAMTAHTWDDGDYIPEVFDLWLADERGVFAALVHEPSGRIAAIDKVSELAPGQFWFEGLRVNPDFRGQGISGKLQTHMVSVVRASGARVVRFLTLANNVPIHIAAYRDGFHIVALTRYWRWKSTYAYDGDVAPLSLRPARPEEAPSLHDWWRTTASYATEGLLHRRWTFYEGSDNNWIEAAHEGRLLVELGYSPPEAKIAPAAVMWAADSEGDNVWWQVAATIAAPEQWAPLYRGLLEEAERQGVTDVEGLFADVHSANVGLKAAGLQPDPDHDRLYVFALPFKSESIGAPSA